MATVHSILVNLAANTARFNANMKGARGQVSMFSRAVKMAKAVIVPAMAALGAAFTVHKLTQWVGSSIEAADAAWKMSGAMGMTTESLMALQNAAGRMANTEAEAFTTSLQKMVQTIGDAALAGGPAAETLNRIGLSAAALAGQSPDQAFLAIAGALEKIQNPAERASVLVDLFGKSGAKLGPMFNEGAAGIQRAMDQAKAWGVAINDVDAAKLAAAKDQMEELGARFEGIKNQLAIAVIPYVSAFIEELLKILPSASTMQNAFVEVFGVMAAAIGVAADGFHYLKIGVLAFTTGAVGQFMLLWKAVMFVGEGVLWVYNKLTGATAAMPEWAKAVDETLSTITEGMFIQTRDALNAPLPSTAIDAFFTNVRIKAQQTAEAMVKAKPKLAQPIADAFLESRNKIKGVLDGIAEEIATFGMDALDKKMFDLSKIVGVTPEDMARAKGMIAQLRGLQEQADLAKQGEELTKSLASPFEKYQEAIASADKLLAAGAINADTYARAVAKAQEDVLGDGKDQAAAALVTRRIDFRLPADARKPDKQAQLVALQKAHLAETKKQTAAIEAMERFAANYDVVLQAG